MFSVFPRGMYTSLMGIELPDLGLIPDRPLYGGYSERYPAYPSWLNGNTWELDYETDLGIPPDTHPRTARDMVNRFRSGLAYQARTLGLHLVTKSTPKKVTPRKLHVRAYE
jgi:hypothetical protein